MVWYLRVCRWLCASEVPPVCDTDLECLAVFHSPGLFWLFIILIFSSPGWFLRNDTCIPPPFFSRALSVSILFVPFITISIVALVQLDPKVGKCHMWFCAIVWHLDDSVEDYLHMWMDRSLCISYCVCARAYVFVCVCVFFCLSMWTGTSRILLYLSSLHCSLSLPPVLLCMMFIGLGGLPTFSDWSLAALDVCWFACLARPLVMWCALDWLRVICVWNSVNVLFRLFFGFVYFIVFNWWFCCLNHPLSPSFFKGSNKVSLEIYFWMPVFLKYILFLLVLFFCADGCIVCARNCLTTLLYPWF